MEKLKTKINGIEYEGHFKIIPVDKEKFTFSVSFRDLNHKDMSLFKYRRESQAKIHAEFVLKNLVEQHLEKQK